MVSFPKELIFIFLIRRIENLELPKLNVGLNISALRSNRRVEDSMLSNVKV
jgi:hypothetical protein